MGVKPPNRFAVRTIFQSRRSIAGKRNRRVKKDVGRIDVGKSSAQRGQFKKVVSPSQKKSAVAHAVPQRLCSVRRACTYLSLPRSTYRYIPKPLTDRREQLYQRNHCFILASSALWLPPPPRLVGKRGLGGKSYAGPAHSSAGRA